MSAPDETQTPQAIPRLTPGRKPELEMIQPFGHDVCATWRDAVHGSEVPMNEGALQSLRVLEAEGRVTLLNAPRAGHGKTHLLGRVARRLQDDAVVAGLPWTSLDGLSWQGTGRGILLDLARAGKNPTQLQRVTGGLLATLLRRLIQTGRVPSTDPIQALRVLSQDPMQLFSESGPASVIGAWFRRHFDQLVKPLSEASALESPDAGEGWLKALFGYMENPGAASLAALEQRLETNSAVEAARLVRLITAWKPLVLVADHMDGLYRDPQAGVAIARMALSLVSMPGVHVVLSMNQDLWETTFGGQLPSALEDRLNSWSVPLRGPTPEEAKALLSMRLEDAGVEEPYAGSFLSFIDLDRFFIGRPVGSVSARALLRHAAQNWRHWLQAGAPVITQAPEEPPPALEGFLLDEASPVPEPEPAPPAAPDELPVVPEPASEAEDFPSMGLDDGDEQDAEDEEALRKLAQHLAQDAGGTVVDLATGPGTLSAHGAPPPDLFNIVPTGATPATSPAGSHGEQGAGNGGQPEETGPSSGSSPATAGEPYAGSGKAAALLTTTLEMPGQPKTSLMESGSFQRLRHLLAQVKTNPGPTAGSSVPSSVAGGILDDATKTKGTLEASAGESGASMLSRFEEARQEISGSGRAAQIELPVLADLVRLAGKRFPVITYDEIELPGLLGRSIPRWTLQGMELLFGLEEFSDTRYWRTVSTYLAGRIAELQVLAIQSGEQPAQLKLVVFKGDVEGPGLAALFQEEVIPSALRPLVDAVHLDARSLASLYAMHQLVRDAETGSVQVDANSVLGTLANELDFFWKRLTRPRG